MKNILLPLLFALTIVVSSTQAQEVVSICDIQGTSFGSPFEDESVTTSGIISALFLGRTGINGFFIEDPSCQENHEGSSGIFVYTGSDEPSLSVGDEIQITAGVKEFFELTELTDIDTIIILSQGNVLTPTEIIFPVEKRSNLENYEGMWVKINDMVVTDHFNLAQFGEITLAKDDLLPIPTQIVDVNDADPAENTYEGNSNLSAINDQNEFNKNRYIILDDGSTMRNPDPTPYVNPDNNTLVAGSAINEIEAIMHYSFNEYRLHPTIAPQIDYAERAPAYDIQDIEAEHPISFAAFNVLNYFTTLDVWGATTEDEFQRQKEKLVSAIAMLDADVLGVIEMENNGSDAALDLLQACNEAMDRNYTLIDPDVEINYNTKSVIFYDSTKLQTVQPIGVLRDPIFERPTLAQTFGIKGLEEAEILYVLNHFRFKGCDGATGADLDQGDGQACFNHTRLLQAQSLEEYAMALSTRLSDLNILLMGDFNAYYHEDPMDFIRGSILYESLFSEDENSYVFRGEWGALDHAFATPNIVQAVVKKEIVNINSLEPRALAYNGSEALYAPDFYRSSDHDPVIVTIDAKDLELVNNTELSKTKWLISPNPSSDHLIITPPNQNLGDGGRVRMVDVSGSEVLTRKLDNAEMIIDISHFNEGMYIVEIMLENGTMQSEKVFVRR